MGKVATFLSPRGNRKRGFMLGLIELILLWALLYVGLPLLGLYIIVRIIRAAWRH